MNTQASLLAALCMLALAPSCSVFQGPRIELAQATADHPRAPKLLDARVTRFRYRGGAADDAVHRLFDALKQQGYRFHYLYDGEAPSNRGLDNVVDVDLRDCEVRTVLSAILSQAGLGYSVQKFGFVIDCAEDFHPTTRVRDTWAGSVAEDWAKPSAIESRTSD